jgi:hypothetical protein
MIIRQGGVILSRQRVFLHRDGDDVAACCGLLSLGNIPYNSSEVTNLLTGVIYTE